MSKEFNYKQPKTTDSYRKGWEKAFSKKRKYISPYLFIGKGYSHLSTKDKEFKQDPECDTCNGQHNNIIPCPKCGMLKDTIDE